MVEGVVYCVCVNSRATASSKQCHTTYPLIVYILWANCFLAHFGGITNTPVHFKIIYEESCYLFNWIIDMLRICTRNCTKCTPLLLTPVLTYSVCLSLRRWEGRGWWQWSMTGKRFWEHWRTTWHFRLRIEWWPFSLAVRASKLASCGGYFFNYSYTNTYEFKWLLRSLFT